MHICFVLLDAHYYRLLFNRSMHICFPECTCANVLSDAPLLSFHYVHIAADSMKVS